MLDRHTFQAVGLAGSVAIVTAATLLRYWQRPSELAHEVEHEEAGAEAKHGEESDAKGAPTAPAARKVEGSWTPGIYPIPEDEEERMKLLRSLDILDSAAEAAFDHITNWGRHFYEVPICVVTLVDADRQWFKACYGLAALETDRDVAFCAHAIMPGAPDVFEVCDATEDVRFANNPLVVGAPFIRYYAGAPLLMEGRKLGTLCILDTDYH